MWPLLCRNPRSGPCRLETDIASEFGEEFVRILGHDGYIRKDIIKVTTSPNVSQQDIARALRRCGEHWNCPASYDKIAAIRARHFATL